MDSLGPLAAFLLWVFMILVCFSQAKLQQHTLSSTLPLHRLAHGSHFTPALLQPDFILSDQGTQGDAKAVQATDQVKLDPAKKPAAAEEHNLIASAREGSASGKEFLKIKSNGEASGQSGAEETTTSHVIRIDGGKEEGVQDEEEQSKGHDRLKGLEMEAESVQKFHTRVGQLGREGGRWPVSSELPPISTTIISPKRVLQAAALNHIGVPNRLQDPGTRVLKDTKITARNLAGDIEPKAGKKKDTEGGQQDLKLDAKEMSSRATGIDPKKIVKEAKDNQSNPPLEKAPIKPSIKESKDDAEKPSDDNHVGVKNGEQDSETKDECDRSHGCAAGKVFACLRTPGAGTQELSLWIKNEGDKNVNVVVTTPDFLRADPSDLNLEKGTSKAVRIVILADKHNDSSKITVSASELDCHIEVPIESFVQHSIFKGFNYSSPITPVVGVYLLLFIFVAIAAVWLYCRYRRKKWHFKGVNYQELEMGLPGGDVFTNNGQRDGGGQNTDGWDEVWDDGWEDAEAARSSLQLTQSLSSKGLAARRSNRDGWDD